MKAKRVIESVEFQRGADPYTSLGIGKSTQRDFSGGRELIEWAYNFPAVWSKGEILEWNDSDYIIRKPFGGYLEEVYIQRMRNIKLIVIKWIKDNITINGEPLSLKESMNMFEEIQKFVIKNLEKERGIRESIDFNREGEPLEKLSIGKYHDLKKYPRSSVEDFMDWYDKEIDPYYLEEDESNMIVLLDSIINDDVSSDEEFRDYWIKEGVNPELIEKLIMARPYFWDFEYTKNLG